MVGKIMELRDLVLSTLEELDEKIEKEHTITENIVADKSLENIEKKPKIEKKEQKKVSKPKDDDEIAFLKHTKERLQVLFEGLKSEEISHHEEKLDLTLKYLQLLFAQIDQRIEAKEV